jgi:hypothetical protein
VGLRNTYNIDMRIKLQFQIIENGIEFKRLIGSKVIPFSDIRSICLLDGKILFTTQGGEEIETVANTPVELYAAVIANNISFYDETEHEEKYYTREELNPLIAAATEVASKAANDYIKEHLGEDYSIDTELLEEPNEINLCFVLFHNGTVVTDLPSDILDQDPERVPGCCDSMALAWLNEWDSASRSGKYGIVVELRDPDICRKTQLDSMKFVVEVLKGE